MDLLHLIEELNAKGVGFVMLADNYEDFDKLIETMELKHRIELEAVYKKGIRHGAFVQKLL